MRIFSRLSQSSIFRYIFIGGLSYLIEVGLLALLIYGLKMTSVLAVGISFWLGFLIAFVLQKLIAFKNTDRSKKTVARQTLLYSGLVGVNYLFTLAFVAIFGPILGTIIARTIALIITTGWNYVIYSKLIFRSKNETQ